MRNRRAEDYGKKGIDLSDPSKIPLSRETIDSHSSMVTNLRLNKIFEEIDRAGIIAKSKSLTGGFALPAYLNYFSSLDQLYMSIDCIAKRLVDDKPVKDGKVKINPIRVRINDGWKLIQEINTASKGDGTISPENLYDFIAVCRDIDLNIKGLLQTMNYFFRTSSKLQTGLKYIDIFEKHSIFSGGHKEARDYRDEGDRGAV